MGLIKVEGYFADKWRETDIKQINLLPENLRKDLFHGTADEAFRAINDIRVRERIQKITLLGEAALEYIYDFRAMREQFGR